MERADDVQAYLDRTGVEDALRTDGNLGALLLRGPSHEAEIEFVLLTFWETEAAIRSFAGDDPYRAVTYAEDSIYFTRYDERVEHLLIDGLYGLNFTDAGPTTEAR